MHSVRAVNYICAAQSLKLEADHLQGGLCEKGNLQTTDELGFEAAAASEQ